VVADAALAAYIARVNSEHFSMFGAITPAEFEAAYHRRQQERASPPDSNRQVLHEPGAVPVRRAEPY
jgi:hypothetical protein